MRHHRRDRPDLSQSFSAPQVKLRRASGQRPPANQSCTHPCLLLTKRAHAARLCFARLVQAIPLVLCLLCPPAAAQEPAADSTASTDSLTIARALEDITADSIRLRDSAPESLALSAAV